MTLNTSVYILDQADPHETFYFCRDLLDTPENTPVIDEERKPFGREATGERNLHNPGGIGLDAWLWMYYKPGEMLFKPGEHYYPEDCEGDRKCTCPPPHWFDVTFDTTYSYRGKEGHGCGALHASLVAKLGMWLDEQGIRWAWDNEFTGEIHVGDRYEHLFDLIRDGDKAWAWFEEIVKPLIEEGFRVPAKPQ